MGMKKGRVFVQGLSEEIVMHADQVMESLAKGMASRMAEQTEWNERSSRSHVVFSMVGYLF